MVATSVLLPYLAREGCRSTAITIQTKAANVTMALAACEYSSTTHSHASPEREIQIKEIVDCMDEWMKEVWSARMYGYSWADIGAMVQLTEQQAKMRFRYALAKIRTQLIGGGKAGGTASPRPRRLTQ